VEDRVIAVVGGGPQSPRLAKREELGMKLLHLLKQVFLLDVRKHPSHPAGSIQAPLVVVLSARWEGTERVHIQVQPQRELPKIVVALRAAGRLARLLHSRQQQRDQDPDDRDHHQQLDESKRTPTP